MARVSTGKDSMLVHPAGLLSWFAQLGTSGHSVLLSGYARCVQQALDVFLLLALTEGLGAMIEPEAQLERAAASTAYISPS
eukprot:1144255-Pelagomonas_calceolata.AAC.6